MGLFLPSLYSLHVYQGKRLFQDIIGDAHVSPLNSVIVFEGKIPISSCILRTRFPMRAQWLLIGMRINSELLSISVQWDIRTLELQMYKCEAWPAWTRGGRGSWGAGCLEYTGALCTLMTHSWTLSASSSASNSTAEFGIKYDKVLMNHPGKWNQSAFNLLFPHNNTQRSLAFPPLSVQLALIAQSFHTALCPGAGVGDTALGRHRILPVRDEGRVVLSRPAGAGIHQGF